MATRLEGLQEIGSVEVLLQSGATLRSELPAARLRSGRAHALLDVAFQDATVRLSGVLGPDELSRLSPGGYLDVVERTEPAFFY